MAARSSIFAVLCLLVGSSSFVGVYFSSLVGSWWMLQPRQSPSSCLSCRPRTGLALISPERGALRAGSLLHYRIPNSECASGSNETELHHGSSGGAFWSATLDSRSHPQASTAGHIVDHLNGTYSVYFYAGWAGEATVSLTRVLSSEAAEFLKWVVWPAEDRVVWHGFFRTREGQALGEMPRGLCRLRSHGARPRDGMCEYPRPRALGSTVFVCEKPDGVTSCDSLLATKSDGSWISARVRELTKGREHMFKSCDGYREKVQIAEPTIHMSDPKQGKISALPKCTPDQDLPLSHGYWLEGQWHSLICQINDWTQTSKLNECLRGRNLILLGDSTTRQWFIEIHNLMGLGFARRPDEWHFTWRRHYEHLNATILYAAHPQLVGSQVVYLDEVHYEVDVIDGLTDPSCDYIVLVSPWAHFSQWTRARYVDRTERLRDALVGLRERCPDVKIVLKGPHAREHNNFESIIYSSDYIIKEIEKINRNILHGIGVLYLPVWAMNLAHPAPNTVHMPMAVIIEELRMFFSYVCDE